MGPTVAVEGRSFEAPCREATPCERISSPWGRRETGDFRHGDFFSIGRVVICDRDIDRTHAPL